MQKQGLASSPQIRLRIPVRPSLTMPFRYNTMLNIVVRETIRKEDPTILIHSGRM